MALIMLIVGVALWRGAKESYTVRIIASGGETNAFASRDRKSVEQIVGAINDVITRPQ
jgi:hypothetical protein